MLPPPADQTGFLHFAGFHPESSPEEARSGKYAANSSHQSCPLRPQFVHKPGFPPPPVHPDTPFRHNAHDDFLSPPADEESS